MDLNSKTEKLERRIGLEEVTSLIFGQICPDVAKPEWESPAISKSVRTEPISKDRYEIRPGVLQLLPEASPGAVAKETIEAHYLLYFYWFCRHD